MNEKNDKPLTGYEKRIQNLRPFKNAAEINNDVELKRQRDLQSKGGKACIEQKRVKKNLKETALALLETEIDREHAKKLIGDKADLIPDDNLTVQAVLTVKLAAALIDDGNARAFELLRDTSGQKPRDEITVTSDIMTDADRALLENINARLNEKAADCLRRADSAGETEK